MSSASTTANARSSQSGYSLIELMISLVIVSVVAAMAMPVAQRAIHQSHRGRMLHTLRTLSDDQLMFQRDNGTYYPAGVQSGETITALGIYPHDEPLTLHGQGTILPAGRKYTYYIVRDEPAYAEPVIYAYAQQSMGNDLDGDAFPDVWVKVGSGPPQLYYDDFNDEIRSIELN